MTADRGVDTNKDGILKFEIDRVNYDGENFLYKVSDSVCSNSTPRATS